MRGGGFGPAGFGNGQGQRLQPVIFQHDGSDIVSHGFQQDHTFGLGQFTATFCRCQCDLDVHFIVGTVHACRIVDEIGIGTPARQRKFDAACLRDAKVCTFANNLGADRIGIYPQAVIGRITDGNVIFRRCLDVSANPAKPEEIGRGCQNG